MLAAFQARLEAKDPARNHFRSYRIDAGVDLLGDWLVDVTYGRIGTPGRRIRHVACDEADARKIVRHCLQRRSSAPRRIGVPYQLTDLADPGQWIASHSGRDSSAAAAGASILMEMAAEIGADLSPKSLARVGLLPP